MARAAARASDIQLGHLAASSTQVSAGGELACECREVIGGEEFCGVLTSRASNSPTCAVSATECFVAGIAAVGTLTSDHPKAIAAERHHRMRRKMGPGS